LAYEAYTHFTSPIRRYPDLLVHRVIKAVLLGRRYELTTGRLVAAPAPAAASTQSATAPRISAAAQEAWETIGAHCSANERRADEASRDVEAWLKCRYMRERLGEEFSGTVTSVASFGVFVTLDALYVEGLVHITELGGEYYRFDEARQELRGERTGLRYTIGARVRIQVSRVDLDGRRIDFRMVHETEQDPSQARARTTPRGGKSATEELADVELADRRHRRASQAAKAASRPSKRPSAARAGAKPAAKSAEKGSGAGSVKSPVAKKPARKRS
jgi:ribonuclease R